MSTHKNRALHRRALGLLGLSCAAIAGVLALLGEQAEATPTVFQRQATQAISEQRSLSALVPARREQAAAAPLDQEPARLEEVESPNKEEELSYNYTITHEGGSEGVLVLETAGALWLRIDPGSKGERSAQARLSNIVAWQAEGIDTVFLTEVMASTATFTLSPVGAIQELQLPRSLSSEAERYWKCVLGRWQTAGPAKPKYSERWRAAERNEYGSYSALYEPDAERGDGTVRKVILGYRELEDVESRSALMCEGEVIISPGERPSSIEGHETLLVDHGHKKTLSFSYQRTN